MQKQAQDYNERINQLTNEYTLWGIKNGFIDDDLKSADEMLYFYPNLTVDQIIPKGSKGKMFSHRPQRSENSYWDEKDRKHYKKPELKEGE